jgi:hypothetical protein
MSKWKNATVKQQIPADKFEEIQRKHSCSFTCQGEKCTYGMKDGRLGFDIPVDAQPDIMRVIKGAEKVERQVENMDQLEVYELLYKVYRMKYRILKEARKNAVYEQIDEEPLDLENMTLEERCLLEVLQEQSERARTDGTNEYTITKEMLDNKIEMKLLDSKNNSGR